ncbi:hypothetical protein [Microbacterium caowuchunii]|uniref:Lipoprotein n=1 Tax=Microbacterium caowuchunii TaxID=2614638 RepID=A0A5N0T7C6_9MICO|nr:hypothetical protein [Microbacterium caowuchunii]KAA9130404.1 hypothetical protein F6B40_14350 [Microbacterium caowuchunii]
MSRRGWAMAGMALVAAVALSGCAGTSGGTPTVIDDLEVDAAWVDNGRMIALVTWGSSTCAPIAEEGVLGQDGVLSVTLLDPPPVGEETERACTADMAPRATLVGLPEGIDPAQDLDVRVTYASAVGDTELDGVPGLAAPTTPTDYEPSAGWVEEGLFAVVTWGSSSCAPVVEDVQASAEKEVTLTFATPPADRICTMDMAPRVALAAVDGLADDDGVELVLQGDTFSGVRIPILG